MLITIHNFITAHQLHHLISLVSFWVNTFVVTFWSHFLSQMSFVPSLSHTQSMPSSSPPTSSYSDTRVSRVGSQTVTPLFLTSVLLLMMTTKRTVPLIRKMTDTVEEACSYDVHILSCHLNTCLYLGWSVFVHKHMPYQQIWFSVNTTKYSINYSMIYLKAFIVYKMLKCIIMLKHFLICCSLRGGGG